MSAYKRKTDRPYRRVFSGTVRDVEHWYQARLALGGQKQIAARLGITEANVQNIVQAYRSRNGVQGLLGPPSNAILFAVCRLIIRASINSNPARGVGSK